MAVRKFADLANETDSKFNNVKSTTSRAKITERFDDTTHNEQPSDEALQFLNKKVDEVIDALNTNTAKTGITTSQANAITANTAKTGISTSQASAITANTAKTGISTSQASAISANTSKTGITSTQASAITANTAKTGITSTQASRITANTAKTGITTSQASAITANTAKTGISTAQANAITANTAKVSTGDDLIPGTELGKLIASVAVSRGTYTLTFTFTTADGRTTKTANITMS